LSEMIDFDTQLERIQLIKELKANPKLREKIEQLNKAAVFFLRNKGMFMKIERRERILKNLLEIGKKRSTKSKGKPGEGEI